MVRLDESALICDFAETYHILDWRALPLQTAAVLASGLRDNSRIKMKIAELEIPPELMMMAAMVDRLSMLVWAKTEDAQKGRNRPESILAKLTDRSTSDEHASKSGVKLFRTAEEFEEARKRAIKGG